METAPPTNSSETQAQAQPRVAHQHHHSGFDRTDSRVFLSYSVLSWLCNALWSLLIYLKLEGIIDFNWWLVFAPTWISHCVHIPLQLLVLMFTKELVQRQLGPPPGPNSSAVLQMQYETHQSVRQRSHIVSNLNSAVDSLTQALVKLEICQQLKGVWEDGADWASFRTTFIPFWIAWVLTNCLCLAKDKTERGYGNARELQYIFFLFVACKLDGINDYSWKVVFIIPWVCFVVMFCMALMMLFLLLCTCAPLSDRVLQLGIFFMFVSFTPQFVSYLRLVERLDGDDSVSYGDIMVPNVLSWALLFLSSLVMWWGLRARERTRSERQILQQGFWEHQVEVASLEAAQASVDGMSNEDLSKAAEEMAEGKVKPLTLIRVSASLFRRVANVVTDQELQDLPDIEKGANTAGSLEAVGGFPQASVTSPLGFLGPSPEPAAVPAGTGTAALTVFEGDGEKKTETITSFSDSDSELEDDERCIICYDSRATHVFLECGHAGFCKICAFKMWVRPPHECPTCRQKIEQVVELEGDVETDPDLGGMATARIKQ
eukprot:gene21636-26024_t